MPCILDHELCRLLASPDQHAVAPDDLAVEPVVELPAILALCCAVGLWLMVVAWT
ncbi:hypothetical protein [Rhodobaculum claviforme]|uniref:hypothetical protein n=1 Tax=Rhodobaculum claviforme TaxID=1549854 RepID=UPI001F5C2889|nr:hypothetical protein [Rhodobaculum claviforme]